MKRKFEFGSYSEKEYPVYMGYPTMKKEHNFHTEEHFVVPWELTGETEQYSRKSKVWE